MIVLDNLDNKMLRKNSMNRTLMIHNHFIICSSIFVFTSNCYQLKIGFFLVGEMLSKEGTTQGDPIAAAVHEINLTPLMFYIKSIPYFKNVKHADFADVLVGNSSEFKIFRSLWNGLFSQQK